MRELASAARSFSTQLPDAAPSIAKHFVEFTEQVRAALGDGYDRRRAADDFALSIASLAVVDACWRIARNPHIAAAGQFAARDSLCRVTQQACEALGAGETAPGMLDAAHTVATLISAGASDASRTLVGFFEHLLAEFDAARRRELGVYFTPPAAVDFIVERTDRVLREELDYADGLAGGLASDAAVRTASPLRILDPAMGSGAFLQAVVRRIRRTFVAQSRDSSPAVSPQYEPRWSEYVSQHLLPRLCGVEILPAPFVLSNFLLAMELVRGGYRPLPSDRLALSLADTLAQERLFDAGRFNVIVGNPPYRGISSNKHEWITRLLRGRSPDGRNAASYFHVDGEPLGERKVWLHDDYVKFFRYAQWQVEQSGAGVVAFITNHGFLDNPTFRGMRAALMQTFSGIEVIDLHGNAKKGLAAEDESLFETAQGMAITVAWNNGHENQPAGVNRGDLIGTRSEKIQQLQSDGERRLTLARISPRSPHYFFHADRTAQHAEYAAGFRLPEIMPVNTTAAVTARDWFVVDIDRQRLLDRLAEFADLSIADEEIRRRYFGRTRSAKYAPGDTRGWKLSEARRRLASQPHWHGLVRQCWYRPFDRRWIFWAPWMIDWPREDVMRHMQRGNLALVCRRQSVRGKPCNFFWIADDIVIDGYIRSDNRGSESVFPLFLMGNDEFPPQPDRAGVTVDSRAVNFAGDFVAACESKMNAQFVATVAPSEQATFNAWDLLHYVYALFHSPTYRQRYADDLVVDFPRVLVPNSFALFRKLADRGGELARLHLLSSVPLRDSAIEFHGDSRARVDAGFPNYDETSVRLGAGAFFAAIPRESWQFRVGAHQVLRKWLKDRRNRTLAEDDIQTYLGLAGAVAGTNAIMVRIDAIIDAAGGWPAAFTAPPDAV